MLRFAITAAGLPEGCLCTVTTNAWHAAASRFRAAKGLPTRACSLIPPELEPLQPKQVTVTHNVRGWHDRDLGRTGLLPDRQYDPHDEERNDVVHQRRNDDRASAATAYGQFLV